MNFKMAKEEIKKDIINRLKTIKGHIAGVEKMIEEDKCCEDVLIQVTALKASIHKVGLMIIEQHAKNCLINVGEEEEIIDKAQLEKVLDTIIKFAK